MVMGFFPFWARCWFICIFKTALYMGSLFTARLIAFANTSIAKGLSIYYVIESRVVKTGNTGLFLGLH